MENEKREPSEKNSFQESGTFFPPAPARENVPPPPSARRGGRPRTALERAVGKGEKLHFPNQTRSDWGWIASVKRGPMGDCEPMGERPGTGGARRPPE